MVSENRCDMRSRYVDTLMLMLTTLAMGNGNSTQLRRRIALVQLVGLPGCQASRVQVVPAVPANVVCRSETGLMGAPKEPGAYLTLTCAEVGMNRWPVCS